MSKTTKFILTFCIITLLIGGALFGVGMYLGEQTKQNPWFGKNVWGNLDVTVDGAKISFGDYVESVEKEKILEAFDNIHMEVECADVRILAGTEYQISCTFPEEEMPEFKVENNTLQVTQNQQGSNGNTGNVTRSIVVSVPEQAVLKDITLDNVVGNIHMKGLEAYNCQATLSTGNITIENAEITQVTYTISTGNVDISALVSEYCGVSTSTGEIDIAASDIKEYVLVNGVGDTSLDLSKVSYDYSMDAETDVGKVYLDGEEMGTSYKDENAEEYSIKIGKDVGDININTK